MASLQAQLSRSRHSAAAAQAALVASQAQQAAIEQTATGAAAQRQRAAEEQLTLQRELTAALGRLAELQVIPSHHLRPFCFTACKPLDV